MRLVLIATLAALCFSARATTNIAASVSLSDVQAAYALCVNGDTLVIPAGEGHWTNSFQPTLALTITGLGTNSTIIYDDNNNTGTAAQKALIRWTTPASSVGQSKLANISFIQGTRAVESVDGAIQLVGLGTNVVMEFCVSSNLNASPHIWVGDGVLGLAHHNVHYRRQGHGFHCYAFKQSNLYGRVNGNGAWENPSAPSSYEFFFVEDCTFINTSTSTQNLNDGFSGKYVMRFNTAQEVGFGHHGTESSGQARAPRMAQIYFNTIVRTNAATENEWMDVRDGNFLIFSNNVTGNFAASIKLNTYRTFAPFRPWSSVDGTMLWDYPNTNDSFEVPNDGIFETGTSTAGTGTDLLVDNTKSWTNNAWVGYIVRMSQTNTATSGSSSTITVSGAGWTTNEWLKYQVTKLSTGEKGQIISNTGDTLTMDTQAYRPNFTGGGQFTLSLGLVITSNGSTNLVTPNQGGFGNNFVFKVGMPYEIRKIVWALDQTGRGTCLGQMPSTIATLNTTNVNQQSEQSYQWGNLLNSVSVTNVINGIYENIVEGRDYFQQTNNFNGSAGIGTGTAAQMALITPSLTNVAFWVTDEGFWNDNHGGADGQLYVWNGAAWALHFTPYTYPHPLASTNPPVPPPVPAAPSALTATTISSTQINLQWTDNSTNETDFRIERSLTGGGVGFNQIDTVSSNVVTYASIGLSASTTYYYRVRAANGYGFSTYSNEANATTQSEVIPGPRGLRTGIFPRIFPFK